MPGTRANLVGGEGARAPAVAGPSAGPAIGTADGMMGRARTAVGRRRAAPPLATARIKGPGAAARAFNGLRGGLPRRRLPRRLKGDGGRGRARRAGKAKKEAGPRRAPLCTYMQVPSTGQRRPALPRASPAVPSALGGLASGFGMGPGVPRPPWPLTGGRRSAHREVVMCVRADPRALGAAQRGDGPWDPASDPT